MNPETPESPYNLDPLTPDEIPAAATLAEDRPCVRCGYSLMGLPLTGACPECAAPVMLSLRGDSLRYSSPEFLAKLHHGVILVLAGAIASLVNAVAPLGLGFAGLGAGIGQWWIVIAITLTGLVGVALACLGGWLLSEPDPSQRSTDRGQKPRRVLRVAVMVNAVAACVNAGFVIAGFGSVGPGRFGGLTLTGTMTDLALAAAVVSFIAWAVSYFAAMQYVRWLARRLPNKKAHDRARQLMWLGPVLYTVGRLMCIGPLIALILYYNLFDWVRADLKRIRRQQALEAAAGVPLA